jgi:peptide-methionine (R)-S-oxide reductase
MCIGCESYVATLWRFHGSQGNPKCEGQFREEEVTFAFWQTLTKRSRGNYCSKENAAMFDSEIGNDQAAMSGRRTFLVTAGAALAGALLWSLRRPGPARASSQPPKDVTIVEFSDAGERLKTVKIPKVVKTEDEWRKQLPPSAFSITRHADTEMAYSGEYWDLHGKGMFRCVCCGNALFSSDTKFDSGTGWPSFWAPIAAENVHAEKDSSFGMERTAVSCTECDAHLGHVFDDGPEPTHLRYCMNSASLRFVARTMKANPAR